VFIHKDINGSELLGKIGSELTTKTQYVVACYFFLILDNYQVLNHSCVRVVKLIDIAT